MKTIFLSPSDLAFLLDDSPWGFYQKYNLGIKRPPVIIPRIFTVIDVLTKVCCENKNMKGFDPSFPDAVITGADQWVKSKPKELNEAYWKIKGECYLEARFTFQIYLALSNLMIFFCFYRAFG
jgi:hypothetical protein